MNIEIIFSAAAKAAGGVQPSSKAAASYFAALDCDTKEGGQFIHLEKGRMTVLWHLGAKHDLTSEEMQNEGAKALRAAKGKLGTAKSATVTAAFGKDIKDIKEHIEKGMLLANFAEDAFKSKKSKVKVTLKNIGSAKLKKIVDAIQRQRELASTPTNLLDTEKFVTEIKKLNKEKAVKVKVLRKKEIAKEKMNLLLAVGAGSARQPAVAVIEYTPAGTAKDAPVILVGKGVIYDSGGYGLKPGDHQADMYADMAGSATVVGVIQGLSRLGVKKRVIGVCGIVENMIDAESYRAGDIITSKKGLTVEVLHTDAEGRLVLADCLTYAQEKWPKAKEIFDFATLTGGCVYSLGEMYTGLFTDSDQLVERMSKIGKETNDWVWQMPMDKLIRESVKGKRSDIINLSSLTHMLGHSTAAAFLAEFVNDTKKWIHFDIAGTGMRNKQVRSYDLQNHFGSGGTVHLMLEHLSRK